VTAIQQSSTKEANHGWGESRESREKEREQREDLCHGASGEVSEEAQAADAEGEVVWAGALRGALLAVIDCLSVITNPIFNNIKSILRWEGLEGGKGGRAVGQGRVVGGGTSSTGEREKRWLHSESLSWYRPGEMREETVREASVRRSTRGDQCLDSGSLGGADQMLDGEGEVRVQPSRDRRRAARGEVNTEDLSRYLRSKGVSDGICAWSDLDSKSGEQTDLLQNFRVFGDVVVVVLEVLCHLGCLLFEICLNTLTDFIRRILCSSWKDRERCLYVWEQLCEGLLDSVVRFFLCCF
jgi:hypothetical protein